MTETYKYLFDKYGAAMTMAQFSNEIKMTPRTILKKPDLAKICKKIDARFVISTADVAKLIDRG